MGIDRVTGDERTVRLAEPAAEATLHPATVALATPGLLIAEALMRMLRDDGLQVVGCYTTAPALLEKTRRCHPGVVIVDADLAEPPSSPRALLTALRHASAKSRVVVLASTVDSPLAHAVMDCGVCAVILTSSPASDALATVRQVAGGRTSFPAAVLARLGERERHDELSARQLEVLEQLALGLSNDAIARNLYISVNTVKFHIHAIYERLGVHNRVEAAAAFTVRRVAKVSTITRPGGPYPPAGEDQPPLRAIHAAN
jgi:DNA-binding NarL/FixJ family response regulator